MYTPQLSNHKIRDYRILRTWSPLPRFLSLSLLLFVSEPYFPFIFFSLSLLWSLRSFKRYILLFVSIDKNVLLEGWRISESEEITMCVERQQVFHYFFFSLSFYQCTHMINKFIQLMSTPQRLSQCCDGTFIDDHFFCMMHLNSKYRGLWLMIIGIIFFDYFFNDLFKDHY